MALYNELLEQSVQQNKVSIFVTVVFSLSSYN